MPGHIPLILPSLIILTYAPVAPESVCRTILKLGRSDPIVFSVVRQTDPIFTSETESDPLKKSVLVCDPVRKLVPVNSLT